jgi:hypothetical protein
MGADAALDVGRSPDDHRRLGAGGRGGSGPWTGLAAGAASAAIAGLVAWLATRRL